MLYQHISIEDKQQNGTEYNKFADFSIRGEDLALLIVSLCSISLMKVLNHSAQLESLIVNYRGNTSKLQENDPFLLSFGKTC